MSNRQDSIAYNEVAQAEHALAEAHLSMDLDAIDNLLHADYVIIQPGGKMETKAEVLAAYRSDKRYWSAAKADQLDIRFYGDTAVVIGRWQARGKNGEAPFDYSSRFLSMWIKAGDQWKNIAFQATEIES